MSDRGHLEQLISSEIDVEPYRWRGDGANVWNSEKGSYACWRVPMKLQQCWIYQHYAPRSECKVFALDKSFCLSTFCPHRSRQRRECEYIDALAGRQGYQQELRRSAIAV